MSTDLLGLIREMIDRDDPEARERAIANYDRDVLAAAADVYRRFNRSQIIFCWLFLNRHRQWKEVLNDSDFRFVLDIALRADPQLRALLEDLKSGRPLTSSLLREHGWMPLPVDVTEVIAAAGALFHMKILVHDLLKPWIDEIDPKLRTDLVKDANMDKVQDIHWSPAHSPHRSNGSEEHAEDDLTVSVHGIYTSSMEFHLQGDEQRAMLRIRKERTAKAVPATNSDTIIFERLSPSEATEFCRSEEGRRRIVREKLLKAGELL